MAASKGPLYGLVCSGGGAHGAYQVGVLKYVHEKFCKDGESPFQIFAGTSCGAMNTTFLAAESHNASEAYARLEKLWLEFHIPKYHGSLIRSSIRSMIRGWQQKSPERMHSWSLLDPAPLQDIVKKSFRTQDLAKAIEKKTTLGIALSATELISGRTCWFQEGPNAQNWNLFHSIGIPTKLGHSHLEASCSIPGFLPPVKVGKRFYLDGSVTLARPFSAAISMGASKIISIASDKPLPNDLPNYSPGFKPSILHVARMLINQVMYDTSSDEAAQISLLNRFYENLEKKKRYGENFTQKDLYDHDFIPGQYQPVDILLITPSRRIRESPMYTTYESGSRSHRKKTRFLFHKKFIGELMELGYRDAVSQHEELEEFFTGVSPEKRWWHRFGGKRSFLGADHCVRPKS